MLQVRELKKQYKTKKGEVFQALNGVNLDFPNKGFVFIIGKSGSGKSTLLNILGGLDRYDSGEIIIKGKSSKDFSKADFDSYRNTYLGFVFQEFNLLEDMTLAKNVQLALELQSYKGNIDQKVEEILDKVELKEKKNNKINELSGGQKQRVAIARALVKDPEIIIADEPTGNLDSETGKLIMDTLSRLSKEKLVIMVTHDIDYAAEYADRVIELKDGVILSDDTKTQRSLSKIESVVGSTESVSKLIRVPRSKQVDGKLLDELNDVINSNPDKDLYITLSFNKNVVAQIEPKALALSENAKSSVEKVELSYEYEKNFKLIKSKLPSSYSIRMALGNVWRRKIRLFFTLLLMSVAVFLFGQSEAIRRVDFGTTAQATLKTNDTNKVGFYKYISKESDDKYYTSYKGVEQEDYDYFVNNFTDVNVYKLYAEAANYIPKNDTFCGYNNAGVKEFYRFDCSRSSFANSNYNAFSTKDTLLAANQVLIEKNNGLIISDYMADAFIQMSNNQFLTYQALLGQDLFIGYVIAGVYETDFKKYQTRFDEIYNKGYDVNNGYFNSSKVTQEESDYYHNWSYSVKHDYMTIIPSDVENLLESIIISGNNPLHLNKDGNSSSSQPVVLNSSFEKYVTYASDYTKGTLAYNEVVLTEMSLWTLGIRDLTNFTTLAITINIDGTTKSFNVVGYTDKIKDSKYIFTSEELYSEVTDGRVVQNSESATAFQGFIVLQHTSAEAKFLDYLNSKEYYFSDDALRSVSMFINGFVQMEKVFLYMSLGMLAFATFLLFNNISGSVVRKKKEIGTLRAIGARGTDVAKIFIFESLFITILVASISLGGVYYVSNIISSEFSRSFSISNLINVKLIIIAEIYGVSIAAGILAAFIPVKKVSSMRPIDAIRNK